MVRTPEQGAAPTKVRVQRFWRPEDVGSEAGYRAGFWDVYASAEEEVVEVPIEEIVRKCTVLPAGCTGGTRTHPPTAPHASCTTWKCSCLSCTRWWFFMNPGGLLADRCRRGAQTGDEGSSAY